MYYTTQQAHSFLFTPKTNDNLGQTQICTWIFTTALFIKIQKVKKNLNFYKLMKWINECGISTRAIHCTHKKALMHATSYVNLRNVLSKRSHGTLCIIWLQLYGIQSEISGCLDMGLIAEVDCKQGQELILESWKYSKVSCRNGRRVLWIY